MTARDGPSLRAAVTYVTTHDGRCLLAAVLTAVVTAPLVTRPVLTAVTTAVNTGRVTRGAKNIARRDGHRGPVTTGRRDGSCVSGFTLS